MKKYLIGLICFFILFLTGCKNYSIAPDINYVNLDKYFSVSKGCAVFYDENNNRADIYNVEKVKERVAPCSTFKIAATLIALKYGGIKDENTVLKWDGKKRYFDFWNQDLTLKKAFATSAVWYFEYLMNNTKVENISSYLSEMQYGNEDISGGGTFWLDSTLKISPIEQTYFLYRLFNENSSFDKNDVAVLKKIMYKSDLNGGKLYGKTGTSKNGDNGWFVGFFENNNNDKIYFAVRLYENKNISGPVAQKITEQILKNEY